jgi:hypothetical protein
MDFASLWTPLQLMYGRGYKLSPFDIYYESGAALGAGGIANVTRQVAADCWSLLVGWSHLAAPNPAATGVVVQSCEFTLAIQVQDRDLQDAAVISHLSGAPVFYNVLANSTLRHPGGHVLQYPYMLKPGGTLRFTVTNGGVATNNIRINFHTVKLFERGNLSDEERRMYLTAREDYIGQ